MRKLGNSSSRLLLESVEEEREIGRGAIQILAGLNSPWKLPLPFPVLEGLLSDHTSNLDTSGKCLLMLNSVSLTESKAINCVLRIETQKYQIFDVHIKEEVTGERSSLTLTSSQGRFLSSQVTYHNSCVLNTTAAPC